MPASLPGETRTNNLANPSLGKFVTFDPLSGPKGSLLGGRTISYGAGANTPTYTNDVTNLSTGALATGIGFAPGTPIPGGDAGIARNGFNDNMIPGKKILTYAAAPAKFTVATDSFDSTMMYIGGGRMVAGAALDKLQGRPFIPQPYTAGIAIFGAGNGGSRDAGAGPAFTGFALKMTTAAGAVALGGVIETGSTNRSGIALALGQSTFGSDSGATVAPSMVEGETMREADEPPAWGAYEAAAEPQPPAPQPNEPPPGYRPPPPAPEPVKPAA